MVLVAAAVMLLLLTEEDATLGASDMALAVAAAAAIREARGDWLPQDPPPTPLLQLGVGV